MQLKVGDSTEPKIPTLQLCPKTEDIGELQTQNSTCHIQVEHTCMDPVQVRKVCGSG